MDDYPKWVTAQPSGVLLVVANAEEEAACLDGRAIISELKSAQGSTFSIVRITPRPTPPAPPPPPPRLAPQAKVQERADQKADDLAEERAEDRAASKASQKKRK